MTHVRIPKSELLNNNISVYRGAHVLMDDHKYAIPVLVTCKTGNIWHVIDKQGFLHMAEELHDPKQGTALRSLVPCEKLTTVGYNPRLQSLIRWDTMVNAALRLIQVPRRLQFI